MDKFFKNIKIYPEPNIYLDLLNNAKIQKLTREVVKENFNQIKKDEFILDNVSINSLINRMAYLKSTLLYRKVFHFKRFLHIFLLKKKKMEKRTHTAGGNCGVKCRPGHWER